MLRRGAVPRRFRHGCRLAALLIWCGATGCVRLEQVIRVRSSGAVLCDYRYSVASDRVRALCTIRRVIEQRQGVGAASRPDEIDWFFNERAAQRHFRSKGFRITKYRQFEKGGRHHVELSVSAGDIRRAVAGGALGPFVFGRTANGNFVLRADTGDEPHADLSPEQLARLREMCADLWLRLTIEVPTRIIETSAPSFSGRAATWEFDPVRSAAFLQSRPVIDVVFSSDGLDW